MRTPTMHKEVRALHPLPADRASLGSAFLPSHHWRTALAFALSALLCGLLLGGLSAWFLGAVALAGLTSAALTFNFHIPGALVRLLAIGRVATRFGERLSGHRAALDDQCQRRARLFTGLAARPALRRTGWQLGQPQALADYLDDVEDVDSARLRAGLPLLATGFGGATLTGATAFIAPIALMFLLPAATILALSAQRLLRRADPLWRGAESAGRAAADRLGASLAALVPLKAEGRFAAELDAGFFELEKARLAVREIRRAQATFDLGLALFGPLMAVAVLGVAWLAGARGDALLPPLFLAFSWLAFAEVVQGLGRNLLARLRGAHAAARLAETGAAAPILDEEGPSTVVLTALRIQNLPRVAPDGRRLGQSISLRLQAGSPLVLRGASGCGKTSLLKQIAGWLGEETFEADGDVLIDTAARRRMSVLCLHDAAILADTLRANCFAPGRSDAEIAEALAAVELTDRFAAQGLDGWITQETLSLGEAQRLNLARAWLSDRPILLLDEPTEHLDRDQAQRILARLLARLSSRIVVLSSHRPLDGAGLRTITL
ncbi:ATP-binding cassette domain-containing protein [Rhizobium sp. YIM 134829]|uniref:ATP-binding cassette domain-containing protein n=1 Tax=Rhizobium sp. YIM 134829 TaxID=3390453 RepID=UPI00397E6D55